MITKLARQAGRKYPQMGMMQAEATPTLTLNAQGQGAPPPVGPTGVISTRKGVSHVRVIAH